MNKTKRNILMASRDLFNKEGLTNVSQRDITTALKISPGNLTYHFKKKEDLIEALYFEFIALIEEESKQFLRKEINLKAFYQLTEKWFSFMYEYRFIFNDITNLTKMSPAITANYKQFVAVRASIFFKIIHHLIDSKMIRKEELNNEYEGLYDRLHIISDFYLSSISVFNKKINKTQQQEHQRIFFHSLYPYLTKNGKQEFLTLFKNS